MYAKRSLLLVRCMIVSYGIRDGLNIEKNIWGNLKLFNDYEKKIYSCYCLGTPEDALDDALQKSVIWKKLKKFRPVSQQLVAKEKWGSKESHKWQGDDNT